ncbi:MAG TPA: BrnA antitoxin family protein, partial [Candidatus Sulfotelmatobacter sp.]|nr:BrnA antitoxin family protein [Candidatus Sulfotelmatobacter sp.]
MRSSLNAERPSRTDVARLRALGDREIARAAAADPDAAPALDAAWFAAANMVLPPKKQTITIRVDKDVLAFFQQTGPGYQTRINAVLRAFVE